MKYTQFTAARADTGAVLPFARVTVYTTGTLTKANLFASDGVTGISNPVEAGTTGLVSFGVADGTYDIQVVSADGMYSLPLMEQVEIIDLTNIRGTVASGRLSYATWAELAAITDTSTPLAATNGMVADIPSTDTGTHTDPVVGGTVANSGVFRYQATAPKGWKRIYNSLDSAVQEALAATAAQSASLTAASLIFQSLSLSARDGGTLGQSAIGSQVVLTRVVSPGNALNTSARWAKAFDAGAVNDDNTVKIASVVSGIVIQASIRNASSAATVRGRVWRRALTSPAINSAPGAAGDELIADTGAITPPSNWPNFGGSGGQGTVVLPVAEFEVASGFTYFPDIEWRDSGGALLTTFFGHKQLGANVAHQRYAGFSYIGAGATSWSNAGAQRPWAMGFATRTLKSITAIETLASKGGTVAATAEASLLTPMERLMIEEGGAWDKVKRPGTDTVGNGLALLFGDSTWAPGVGRGQFGVDFGPTTPLASLVDGKTYPQWIAGTKRLALSGTSVVDTLDALIFSGFKLDDGFVDVAATFPQALILRNFDIRTPNALLQAVQQGNSNLATILLENGHMQGQYNRNINIGNGTIRRCSFDLNGGDCIGGGGVITLEQSLMRRPAATGYGDVGAHGDIMQLTGGSYLSITGSTFYYPAFSTTFDEGVKPSTNCIRIESGPIGNSSPGLKCANAIIAGNILAGAGYTVGLAVEGAGHSIENFLFLGNRYAPLVDYTVFGHFTCYSPRSGDTTGFFRNIAIFDEYLANGTPITVSAGSASTAYAARTEASWKATAGNPNSYRPYEEKWGIFDFDRSKLDARTIEALKRYGKATGREILRWNNALNPAYNLGSIRGV